MNPPPGHADTAAPAPPRGARKLALILITVLVPVVLVPGLCEIVLRLRAAEARRQNEAAWAELYASRPPLQQGLAALKDLLQASPHPDIVYELRPGIEVTFRNARVSVNELGFRGPAFTGDGRNVFRIVALGDSSLFGWGVNEGETYIETLTALLNEAESAVRTEALNTGVPGYNTSMELATLTNRCLRYEPDLVLVHHVVNDVRLPQFLSVGGGRRRPLNSYVLDLLLHRGRALAGEHDGLYMRDPEDVPEAYRHMIGEAACMDAFREIKRVAERDDFGLLVYTDTRAPDYLKHVAEELQVPLLELSDGVGRYMGVRGLEDRVEAGVVLSRHDDHYSALGHRLIAEYLAEQILADPEIRRRREAYRRP